MLPEDGECLASSTSHRQVTGVRAVAIGEKKRRMMDVKIERRYITFTPDVSCCLEIQSVKRPNQMMTGF